MNHHKSCISLAKTYILDADQYLDRYSILSKQDEQLVFPLAWELKLFVDLMIAYECMIKAIYCDAYNIQSIGSMKKIHNISELTSDLEKHFNSEDSDTKFFY